MNRIIILFLGWFFMSGSLLSAQGRSVQRTEIPAGRPWHKFLLLDSTRTDSAYILDVSEELRPLVESGEYDYICVDQSVVEWLFVDQYVKGNSRLKHLVDYYAVFRSPLEITCGEKSPTAYHSILASLLVVLKEYNQKAQKPVGVIGLNFLPDLKNKQNSSWLTYPVVRRVTSFNESTLTDSLMALTDKWWNSRDVARNSLKMMEVDKKALTSLVGREYYVLWKHFYKRYGEYQSLTSRLLPDVRRQYMREDFDYIDKELPGRKIILGYDWFVRLFALEK